MKKTAALLLALFLVVYIMPLGVRLLVVPDETRYAEIPREMLASGDWTVPHLVGVRYFEKTPMGYWLGATAIAVFGENRFAVRLPSALSTGLSALMILLLVRRFTRSDGTAMFAAAVFLTCTEVFAIGVYNVLDPVLSMFLTAAMVSFLFAYDEDDVRRRYGFIAAAGVCTGLAFLTKGFLAFAVPVVSVVPFLLWERRWRDLYTLPWIALFAALAVVLPWSITIHLREPRFWHYFFWIEHVKRFASENPQHAEPFWYYIPYVIGGALPWTVLAPAAVSGMRTAGTPSPFVRFAICWCIFPLLLFSLAGGKIATYILPCFAPLAILIAVGLRRYFDSEKTLAFSIGALVLAAATAVGAAVLLLHQVTDVLGDSVYGKTETWKWVLAAGGLFAASVVLLLAVFSGNAGRRLPLFLAVPLLFFVTTPFLVPDQFGERKTPGAFLRAHADKAGPDAILVSRGALAVSVSWAYKRDDVYLLGGAGELDWGLEYEEHRRLTVDEFAALLELHDAGRVVLFDYGSDFAQYRNELPQPRLVATYGRFVLARY